MATVWVALLTEAMVLLAVAGAAVKWVRQSSASATLDQECEQAA